jgi:AmmeMemoRadiSam system protein B
MMEVRSPAVAGMFYPREPSHLEQLLERFLRNKPAEKGVSGIVSPHAGYVYSGDVAGYGFSAIDPGFSGTFVIIGPSHAGYSTCASLIPWETPLGIVDTDSELVDAMNCEIDEVSHRDEHSIEVQLPFIKYRFPRARIAPVMMGPQDNDSAVVLAEQILAAVRRTQRDVRVIASSDFSHYVPQEIAESRDLAAIEALYTLDIPQFYQRIQRGVSACGYGPIAAMCMVCEGVGAKGARLLRYATSGDVTGDRHQVVGYASIAVI